MDRIRTFTHILHSRAMRSLVGSLLVFLASCGGGGGSGASAPGGNGMTLQERSQVTGDVAARYEELLANNSAKPFDELKRYMETMPVFTEAGAEEGAVWGKFKDGRYFVFSDVWPVVPRAQSAALQRNAPVSPEPKQPTSLLKGSPQLQGPAQLRASASLASGPELPGSNKAVLLSLDDPADEAFVYGKGTINRIRASLQSRGWAVNAALPAANGNSLTVEALKSVSGASVVYLNTHTAVFGPTGWFESGRKSFSIMTDTKASDENEILYKADLDDGSLIYHRKRDLNDPRGMPRYAATPVFIRKHLRLAQNSLAVLMSCNAGTEQGNEVVSALQDAGAGTIIAWDGYANARGFATVETLFDRMAGTNQTIPLFEGGQISPPAVPNRAFSFADVWQYLEAKGLLVQQGADEKHPTAYIRKFGDGFLALSPILREFVVAEDRIYAFGTFGSTPGTVTVGGVQVMPVWSNDSIQAVIANDARGEVVVSSVEKHKSNPRVIGSWRGVIEYRNKKYLSACPTVALTDEFIVNAHLRADMHAVRQEVDGPLLNYVVARDFSAAPDTLVNWQSSGQCFGNKLIEGWSGSGSYHTSADGSTGGVSVGRINAVEGRFQITHAPGLHAIKTIADYASTTSGPALLDPFLQGFVNPTQDLSTLMPFGTFIPLDSSLSVVPNQQVVSRPDGSMKLEMSWHSFTVDPPFDDKIGR